MQCPGSYYRFLQISYGHKNTPLMFTCSKSTIETTEKGVKYVQN